MLAAGIHACCAQSEIWESAIWKAEAISNWPLCSLALPETRGIRRRRWSYIFSSPLADTRWVISCPKIWRKECLRILRIYTPLFTSTIPWLMSPVFYRFIFIPEINDQKTRCSKSGVSCWAADRASLCQATVKNFGRLSILVRIARITARKLTGKILSDEAG